MARQSKSSGSGRGQNAMATAGGADAKGVDSGAPAKTRTSIPQFIKEVRQETAKVTWPTRKETTITTIMVFIMVTIASIFFFFADWLIGTGMRLIFSFTA